MITLQRNTVVSPSGHLPWPDHSGNRIRNLQTGPCRNLQLTATEREEILGRYKSGKVPGIWEDRSASAEILPPFGRERPLFLRYRDAGNFHVDGAQMVPAGEVQGFPVIATEAQISSSRRSVHDPAQLFPLRIHDP